MTTNALGPDFYFFLTQLGGRNPPLGFSFKKGAKGAEAKVQVELQ
jgi:hypothetical protein